jgi:hypothetical protein
MALTSSKTSVVIVNELRSHSVHAAFLAAFEPTHTIKRMPASKLDDKYQHPLIEVRLTLLLARESVRSPRSAWCGSPGFGGV